MLVGWGSIGCLPYAAQGSPFRPRSHAQATFEVAHSLPETAASFALVNDPASEQAEIVDEA
jgi:hypothetical protein